ENNLVKMSWNFDSGQLKPTEFVSKIDGTTLDLSDVEIFSVTLVRSPHPERRVVKASEMTLTGPVTLKRIEGQADSTRLADRQNGWQLEANLQLAENGIKVTWKAILRDGSSYVRQIVALNAEEDPVEIVEFVLFEGKVPEAQVAGRVEGSPIVSDHMFFGIENPASESSVSESGMARCSYPFFNAVDETPFTLSAVIGVYPEGQLRRGFLYYLERERACPYRPFLQHNNGERIGEEYYALVEQDKIDEAAEYRAHQEELWRFGIRGTGEALKQRGVTLASYVHVYEWDNESLVWQFHNGYPNGFASILKDIREYQSELGVWLSPWGGYAGRRFRRADGPKQGLEINQQLNATAFSLAAPRYNARFRAATNNMIKDYSVNYFKFDGFGDLVDALGVGEYRSDFEALWRLMEELRQRRPDIFINTSTGTWPSPFWLIQSDAIWRGGADTGIFGAKGSLRQQWMTFRDAEVHNRVLVNGPLYPISSLMIHGLMINKGGRVQTFNEQDVINEIYSFFATGVNLQELYIDPEIMTESQWDALAEAALWSARNSDVLADVHWVGGDPANLEVYGWGAWSESKAVLSLRNPDDKAATVT
ncbi:MAG: hypothetical protein IKW74_05910, partial [Thermoguttaceae bacterium]|nr:hypothetical protein [Thermoguttaceae bacterium]